MPVSKQHEGTTDHLTSGCPILAKNEYLMRHDKVCTHLHYSICKALGIATTDKWYTQCQSQYMKREMSQESRTAVFASCAGNFLFLLVPYCSYVNSRKHVLLGGVPPAVRN
jgi:hypothetical protein